MHAARDRTLEPIANLPWILVDLPLAHMRCHRYMLMYVPRLCEAAAAYFKHCAFLERGSARALGQQLMLKYTLCSSDRTLSHSTLLYINEGVHTQPEVTCSLRLQGQACEYQSSC